MSQALELELPAAARVLVIRLSALGDIVFALPALQALRHRLPQAKIDWIVEDRHAELLQGHPGVDEVLCFPRSRWRAARGLRKFGAIGMMSDHLLSLRSRGPYDLVLDLQGNLKSALHLLFTRATTSVGFDKPAAREGAQHFLRARVDDPGRCHRSERDLALVRAIGYHGPIPKPTRWPLEREAVREVEMRLGHFLSTPAAGAEDGPLVLLHTEVTHYGRDKAWPDAHWQALAKQLTQELGARVLLLWTPGDRRRVLARCEASDDHCGLAPPTPSLSHLMALLDRADLVIGTDSGPLHLAAYRGSAVVALFGPTDPLRYAPYGPRVEVVYALPDGEEPPPRDRSGPSPLMGRIEPARVCEIAATALLGR